MAACSLQEKVMPRKSQRSSSRQLREILALWEALHAAFERAVRGLPDAALAFRPKPRIRPLGQLVRHTLWCETYYLSCLPGAPKRRPAFPKEFKSRRQLLKAMRLVHKRSLTYLRRLNDEDLDRQLRVSWLPRMSVRQVLLYIITHEVHHRAQVYTYIRLWEPRGRKYARPWWIVPAKAPLVRK
jgi:uncharacterized damage-inducible protein DinB